MMDTIFQPILRTRMVAACSERSNVKASSFILFTILYYIYTIIVNNMSYHAFSRTEPLKLASLRKGDKVRKDSSGKVHDVTKVTDKRFAVDGGSSNKKPLHYSILRSKMGEKLKTFLEKLDKLEEKIANITASMNDIAATNHPQKLGALGHLASKKHECEKDQYSKLIQMNKFLWNIVEGKLANEDGADDDDLQIYMKYEDVMEFRQYPGSAREKLKQFLIAEGVERPPDVLSCVIS